MHKILNLDAVQHFMPHGACWLWDWRLVLLHTIPDLLTFLAYSLIPLILYFTYRLGHLRSLRIAFPKLWKLGMAFIFFCGLSHLGGALEVWIGGYLYYVTGINKIFMAVSSCWFAIVLYSRRIEIASIARAVADIVAQDDLQELEEQRLSFTRKEP